MRFDSKAGLDPTDWRILALLQEDARVSFAEIGRKVRLSAPAVAERVKRLEERGIIRGFRAEVDVAAIGRSLSVYLRVIVQPKDYPRFTKAIQGMEEIFECHHVTGEESFVLRAAVDSVASLEALIQKLTAYGPTTTSLILSTVLNRRHYFVPLNS